MKGPATFTAKKTEGIGAFMHDKQGIGVFHASPAPKQRPNLQTQQTQEQ